MFSKLDKTTLVKVLEKLLNYIFCYMIGKAKSPPKIPNSLKQGNFSRK